MRVAILLAGSRGDVQPYVALARGLARVGHDVVVATHAPFGDFVRANGLDFYPVAGDPRALLTGEAGVGLTSSQRDFVRYLRQMFELARPLWTALLDDWLAASQGAGAIMFNPLAIAGLDIAEALGVPGVMAPIVPLTPTREAPMYLAPDLALLGSAYNLATHGVVRTLVSQVLRLGLDRFRRETLGLAPHGPEGPLSTARQRLLPTLYGYSSAVLPRPADWPALHAVTGYWFLDTPPDWAPPPELASFLADGPAPVYVGYGSMVTADPRQAAAVVLEAVRQVRCRAIVATGWGGLQPRNLPPDVLAIEGAPHDWLFPRMAAVVHHGGAGTTAAALRAGVPSVVTPFFSDQPFWARRLQSLGVAPPALPAQSLDAVQLAGAIRRALVDTQVRARAAALGRVVAAEDGIGRAAELFAAVLQRER